MPRVDLDHQLQLLHHEVEGLAGMVEKAIIRAVEALKQHKSQVSDEDAGVHMRQWRSRTGEKVGFQYAESFKRFRL